jgi:flagellar capping protein FliD
MAEDAQKAVNAGEQASNTPEFNQSVAEGLASVNRRLAILADAVGNIGKPPLISAGNLIALLSALLVLAMATVGAFALSDRINHVDDHLARSEDRLSDKLDKLGEQFTKMDERTSTLEGRLMGSPSPSASAKPRR